MPFTLPYARRVCLLWLIACAGAYAAQHNAVPRTPFDKAQRLREALEGRPEQQRTRRDYERALEAYRAVYHGDPASPKADASISAVADLLAEEGRIFQDDKSLHDAIGQYEFLRHQYPASRYRFSALLTEGEIYSRDLNDRDNAKAAFQQFLKLYPQSALAEQARSELANIRKEEVAERRGKRSKPNAPVVAESTQPAANPQITTPSRKHSNAVLTAAINSQQSTASLQPKPQTSATSAQQKQQRTEEDIPPPSTPLQPSDSGAHASKPQPQIITAPEPSHLSEAVLNAPPPPRKGKLPLVTGVRHWSTPIYTRVAIDLQDEVQYEAARVPSPDRIFFDLHGARLSPELIGKSVEVTDDGFLKRIRAAQFSNDITRIVLDVSDVSDYSAFFLPNPSRLIIDIHGRKRGTVPPPMQTAMVTPPPAPTRTPAKVSTAEAKKPDIGIGPSTTSVDHIGTATSTPPPTHTAAIKPMPQKPAPASVPVSTTNELSSLADVAALSKQPNKVKATRHPTTAPMAASVAGTTPASQSDDSDDDDDDTPPAPSKKPSPLVAKNNPPPADPGAPAVRNTTPVTSMPHGSQQRTMMRALGLKINRIVVDAGHGGHDSGTLGPDGIQEKDVVLDVALRLGKLLKQRLGADVIYTRDDDTFIPLETRTAIANKAQADLFISVHANSSQDASARGVETYYLNFTTSADALEVAARENAVSDQSIHQLSDLVKKIALQDKINESREFASDVEQSLYSGLTSGNAGLKDRGVKKAPFVVLIGANMPSILAEISFLTNPDDAHQLRNGDYRQRIAESLYRGVARYVGSLNGIRIAENSASGTGN